MKLFIILILQKNNNLSQRELQEKIKNNEYNRMSIEARNKLIYEENWK